MDYKKVSRSILKAVGGRDNVLLLENCATRLLFSIKG